jgi:hypothetical protein
MTRAVNTALAGSGGVLQVVTVNKFDTFSMSSTTWADVTGLSVSITPTSTSSRILILGSIATGSNGDFAYIRLFRDSTVIDVGDAAGSRPQVTGDMGYVGSQQPYNINQIPISYIDSPATTSLITYKIQLRAGSSAFAVYINRTAADRDTANYDARSPSNIVLMEIAG